MGLVSQPQQKYNMTMEYKTIEEMAQEYVRLLAAEKGASPETKSYRYISRICDIHGGRIAQQVSDRAAAIITNR